MNESLVSRLKNGLSELKLACSDRQIESLIAYLHLLAKWNKAYNLTAVRDIDDMLALHILDSLAIANLVRGERFLDVGTGPGLPGIPLAILYPDKQFLLIDSNGKKTRFLFQAINELGLSNCAEKTTRVENLQSVELFDGVLSRAFSSLPLMVEQTGHLLKPTGHFYAMKGKMPEEELSRLPKTIKVKAVNKLSVPGVTGERRLVDLTFA